MLKRLGWTYDLHSRGGCLDASDFSLILLHILYWWVCAASSRVVYANLWGPNGLPLHAEIIPLAVDIPFLSFYRGILPDIISVLLRSNYTLSQLSQHHGVRSLGRNVSIYLREVGHRQCSDSSWRPLCDSWWRYKAKSILTDDANKEIPINMTMPVAPPGVLISN